MTPIEYWESNYPEYVAHVSQSDRDLLSKYDPTTLPALKSFGIYNKLVFDHMMTTLSDYEYWKKQGDITKSQLFKKVDKGNDELYESNLIKNGFAVVAATILLSIGLCGITYMDNLTLAGLFTSSLALFLLGWFKWGVRSTHREMGKRIAKAFNLPYPKGTRVPLVKEGRKVMLFLIYIPLCGISAIIIGSAMSDSSWPSMGDFVAFGGGGLIVIDLLVLWITSRKN